MSRRVFYLCLLLSLFSLCLSIPFSSTSASGSSSSHPHFLVPSLRCTTIVVGHAASTDGALTTHTNDCKDCDFRLARIPARSASDTERAVYAARFSYPRYVGSDRGPTFSPQSVDRSIFDWPESKPIGYIPAAERTYAYFDGVYGILNEKGVSMGESTCAARFVSKPVFAGGNALFEISELNRVALERAATAREAIAIMGKLAEQYGFYGSEWEGEYAQGEAGEALTVADLTETWVFHILPDDSGSSAIWVAQRVPDDHVAVVANAFTIAHVNISDTQNFMASENIYDVAIRQKLWDPKGDLPFHFSLIYGARIAFESYCARRQWRVFSLVAPSLKLEPTTSVAELPFSVRPDSRLSVHDLMRIQRDHYEGTEFDLTQGLAAGPYGNPNRYDRGSEAAPYGILFQGTFERPISMFRTAYSSIAQSRAGLPEPLSARLLFASASPHGAVYAPFYPAVPTVPSSFSIGSLYSLTRDSIWWAGTAVANYAERMWIPMQKVIQQAQLQEEKREIEEFAAVESELIPQFQSDPASASALDRLSSLQSDNAQALNRRWWAFFDSLITRFHDGYEIKDFRASTIDPQPIFYPLEWLQAVQFFKGPINWAAKTLSAIQLTDQKAESEESGAMEQNSGVLQPRARSGLPSGVAVGLIASAGLLALGLGFRSGMKRAKRAQYAPLEDFRFGLS